MAQTNGEAVPVAQEKINTDIVTLTRFLTEEQSKHKEATGDFTYGFSHPPSFSILQAFVMIIANLHAPVCYATPCNSPSNQLHTTSVEHLLSTSAVWRAPQIAQAMTRRSLT